VPPIFSTSVFQQSAEQEEGEIIPGCTLHEQPAVPRQARSP